MRINKLKNIFENKYYFGKVKETVKNELCEVHFSTRYNVLGYDTLKRIKEAGFYFINLESKGNSFINLQLGFKKKTKK